MEGTSNADTLWRVTSDQGGGTLDTDPVVVEEFEGGGAVDSVFGRTGDVAAQSGDYSAAQVSYDDGNSPAVVENVQDALDAKEDADADILKADTADELTAGFSVSTHSGGTQSSGTFTPDEADGNFQNITNGGAFTLDPPSNDCNIVLQITNNASAGSITTSNFTQVTGDSFDTTNGNDFLAYITKINGFSHLNVVALQ